MQGLGKRQRRFDNTSVLALHVLNFPSGLWLEDDFGHSIMSNESGITISTDALTVYGDLKAHDFEAKDIVAEGMELSGDLVLLPTMVIRDSNGNLFSSPNIVINVHRDMDLIGHDIDNVGTLQGGTITDGTASLSEGFLTGVNTITASGFIQSSTLYVGIINVSNGIKNLTGNVVIDDPLDMNTNDITNTTNITASGTLQGTTVNADDVNVGGKSISWSSPYLIIDAPTQFNVGANKRIQLQIPGGHSGISIYDDSITKRWDQYIDDTSGDFVFYDASRLAPVLTFDSTTGNLTIGGDVNVDDHSITSINALTFSDTVNIVDTYGTILSSSNLEITLDRTTTVNGPLNCSSLIATSVVTDDFVLSNDLILLPTMLIRDSNGNLFSSPNVVINVHRDMDLNSHDIDNVDILNANGVETTQLTIDGANGTPVFHMINNNTGSTTNDGFRIFVRFDDQRVFINNYSATDTVLTNNGNDTLIMDSNNNVEIPNGTLNTGSINAGSINAGNITTVGVSPRWTLKGTNTTLGTSVGSIDIETAWSRTSGFRLVDSLSSDIWQIGRMYSGGNPVSGLEFSYYYDNGSSWYVLLRVSNQGDVDITGDLDMNGNDIVNVGIIKVNNELQGLQTGANDPAYGFQDSNNGNSAGMYSVSDNNIGLSTNATAALEIDSSQTVSIPNGNLDMGGNNILNVGNLTTTSSGTWTPTVTGSFNINDVDVDVAHYQRIGDIVQVTIRGTVEVTNVAFNTYHQFKISTPSGLPIPSPAATTELGGGTMTVYNTDESSAGYMRAWSNDSELIASFHTDTSNPLTYVITGSYQLS